MVNESTSQIKEKIVQILRIKGPLLPAYIAKEINYDTLFTSAFLSELISEKRIFSSRMRVGSSAIYYLKENQNDLEKYSEHLKSKEKEAFKLLQEKKFLEDEIQEPAIRVALRQIRDFAIPFKKNEKIFWRYFKIQESELNIKEKQEIKGKIKQTKTPAKKSTKSKTTKKTASAKKSEQFFNKVKEFLISQKKEILDIQGVTKDTLTLKIKETNQEILLIAYNKKRITEEDILKAHKKAQELNLKYQILSLGEPSKKLDNFIKALRNLSEIQKIQ